MLGSQSFSQGREQSEPSNSECSLVWSIRCTCATTALPAQSSSSTPHCTELCTECSLAFPSTAVAATDVCRLLGRPSALRHADESAAARTQRSFRSRRAEKNVQCLNRPRPRVRMTVSLCSAHRCDWLRSSPNDSPVVQARKRALGDRKPKSRAEVTPGIQLDYLALLSECRIHR